MTVDRIPLAHSVRYAARGLPDVPYQYGRGVLRPSEVTLTYRTAPDSQLGRVHAYLAGRIHVDGREVLHREPFGQHYDEGLDNWPEWLTEEARLHDPTAEPAVSADRAAMSEKLWALAEHHIVAEWICCEPLAPGHDLCAQGYAALSMARSLFVDDPEAARPAPLLEAVLAELAGIRAAALTEAADAVAADTGHIRFGSATDYAERHAALLRRLAAEAHTGASSGPPELAGPEFKENVENLNSAAEAHDGDTQDDEGEKLATARRMAKAMSAPPVAPEQWAATTEWPTRHKRSADRRVHATAPFVVYSRQHIWTACGKHVGPGGYPLNHMPVDCRGCKQALAADASAAVLPVGSAEPKGANGERERQRADQAEELLQIANQTSNKSEAERARAVAAVARVRSLQERWLKAGPPPIGTSMARWWDARLIELQDAIRPADDLTTEK